MISGLSLAQWACLAIVAVFSFHFVDVWRRMPVLSPGGN